MLTLRRLSHTIFLPALLVVAALLALAVERMDGLGDALGADMVGSLASVAAGLAVAALVLARVSARR